MPEREPAYLGGDPGGRGARDPGPAWGGPPAPSPSPPTRGAPGTHGEGTVRAARGGPTFHVAGFWRRMIGALVDLAILVPLCLLLTWLAGAVAGVHLPASRHRGLDFWLDLFLGTDPALVGGIGLALGIGLIYAFLFQMTTSRTLGMRAAGTRIIDVYGERPSVARAAARTAGYLACVATLGLGFLWIGFDSERRGLHDWVAGTYVVKEKA
ncbi:MAG TPA: RDD family protein [Kofleriaceae bacterium]|nr:RDD family protein [Kofleriaceae bacterium]